ncbi:hypothetical protein STCU_12018 [Strigomonas culicis]|uniref:Uncharacterized protein n=1 Tax=Strigomonas culicis TaxID=28005 RepID=S9UL81_9TRYP|nr:hypothetical protein STCU_12018 [Strigomonas culicis]|eukprot:EPY15451.1 hypothetical protein STCU_12018 [Strigomonas culicis]
MECDAARIAFLEKQVEDLQRHPAAAASALDDLFAANGAVSEAEITRRAEAAAAAQLEVWRGRFTAKLQEQADTIEALQRQLRDAQQQQPPPHPDVTAPEEEEEEEEEADIAAESQVAAHGEAALQGPVAPLEQALPVATGAEPPQKEEGQAEAAALGT